MNNAKQSQLDDSLNKRSSTLLFVVAGGFVLIVGALLLIYLNRISESFSRHNSDYMVDNTSLMSGYVDRLLTVGQQNAIILSKLMSNTLTDADVNVERLRKLIDEKTFDFIEFADVDGWDHNTTGGVSDARDRQYYLDAMEGNSGYEVIFNSRATHETLIMFYSPLYYNGQIVGSFIGAYQATKRIKRAITAKYYGEPATTYLCSPDGRVVSSSIDLDPAVEMTASDIAGDDEDLADKINSAIEAGEPLTFTIEGNAAGGCMMKLPASGWFILQIFPSKANMAMISEGTVLGSQLVLSLLLLSIFCAIIIVTVFRSKDRQVYAQKELLAKAEAEHKIAEEKIRSEQEANKLKSSFVQNMSHDIRTPLNAIVGYSQLLGMPEMYLTDQERAEFAEYINSSADMLTMLLDDVLNVSDIEHGILKINKEDVSPLDICRKSVNCAMMRVPVGVKMYYTVDTDASWTVNTDAKRVQEILVNFLSNACKHTFEGEIHVNCSKDETPGFLTFSVTDTGEGVPEDKAEEIFNRFTTLDGESGGHGMGLSICRNLATLLGGQVYLDTTYKSGARFVLTIPLES